MTDIALEVRAHLLTHFARAGIAGEPDVATVTFLGLEPIDVLRFGPGPGGVVHHVSVGGSRHSDDDEPRAEVVVALKSGARLSGLARSVAVLAAAPAVEGLVLAPDALVDLGQPLWDGAPFTAFLLGDSDIDDLMLTPTPVAFIVATPITPTEAAWVRLKGVDAMREAWRQDGVDVCDPGRPAGRPA